VSLRDAVGLRWQLLLHCQHYAIPGGRDFC